MTQEELYEIIASDESFRIELTTSTGDMDKFQEAICAFANDMPGSRKKGYLLNENNSPAPIFNVNYLTVFQRDCERARRNKFAQACPSR